MGIIYPLHVFAIQGLKREKGPFLGSHDFRRKGDCSDFVFLYSGDTRESFLTKINFELFFQVSLYIWPNDPRLLGQSRDWFDIFHVRHRWSASVSLTLASSQDNSWCNQFVDVWLHCQKFEFPSFDFLQLYCGQLAFSIRFCLFF